jgi:hypothetical protein
MSSTAAPPSSPGAPDAPRAGRAAGSDGTAAGRRRGWGERVRADVPLAVLVGCWVLSRVFYYAQGMRFDTDSLDLAYQFLPRDLLEHDFWRSITHFHAQPPLFNVFLAAGLHSPFSASATFGIVFRIVSLLMAVAMYKLATGLGVPRVAAAIVVGIFTCAPTAAFYEHYLFYTLPVAALLVGATWCFLRWLRTGRDRFGAAFFVLVTALALTRASYHLVWIVAVVAYAFWATRGRTPRHRFALLALPTLLVPAWYVKNALQYDTFAASSWQGMNLARVVLAPADRAEVQRLVDDGTLSKDALVYPFSNVRAYGASHEPTGVPALDRVTRDARHPHDPNLNNLDYVDISKQYQRDSLAYLRRHPVEYLGSALAGARLYFLPSSYNPQVGNNMLKMYDLTKASWRFPDLQPKKFEGVRAFTQPKAHGPGYWQMSYTAVFAYALVLLAGPFLLWRTRRSDALDGVARRTLAFASVTIAFAFLSGTFLELGENNRFRFETDPLVWVVAAAYVTAWLRTRRAVVPVSPADCV